MQASALQLFFYVGMILREYDWSQRWAKVY